MAALFVLLMALPAIAQDDMTQGDTTTADTAAPAEEPAQPTAVDGDRVRGYVPPPGDLKLVDGHWTPYDPPVPPEGAQVHVVEKGDTLWDLAGHYYGEPYLWPIIWDQNRYVRFSHWIYPGDPLVVPPKPMQVTETGVVEPEPEPEEVAELEEEVVDEPPPRVAERPAPSVPFRRDRAETAPRKRVRPSLIPAAENIEMLCASRLYERFDPSPVYISGREEPDKKLQAEGDIIYLSAGQDMGIQPGAEYDVLRAGAIVEHPDTGRPVAVHVRRLGVVRAIAVQPQSTTAQVKTSCDAIRTGDYLVPHRDLPVPMIEPIPLTDLSSPFPGQTNGTVVSMNDIEATLAGTGEMVGIDLGHGDGVTVGDRVLFWRSGDGGPQNPRRVLAQGVVLASQGGGCTVKIVEARSEVLIGDRAEFL